jgi:pyruvate/2-oxoglutarate dehydrogenase complex dihydrolipoamide dehydrogenase (E3) component
MLPHDPPPADIQKPNFRQGVLHADICIIGAGSGGLSVAAAAVQMGASVVLIEKGDMGGDCLNTGCVPSKALIAAAHAAHSMRSSRRFGLDGQEPTFDFSNVHRHIHDVIGAIAPHDSVERFEGLGVTVIKAAARFVGANLVEAGSQKVKARRFVVATGSSAALPPIPGLTELPYLTNESIFDLTEQPQHLIVIGGGPIGVEIAQSFRRLGSKVTVIERFGILAKDETEAVEVVRRSLITDGVSIYENTGVVDATRNGQNIDVRIEPTRGDTRIVTGSHLLVAAGRKPNTSSLGLEAAGIEATPRGITVDGRLRTTNKRVFAIGDVAGGPRFTHIAAYHAGIVIRNALFGLPANVDYKALPWVTYTDPELAHVGLTEGDARKSNQPVSILLSSLAGNDRAQAERETEGLAKIVLGKRGQILGATIVGPRAGELIALWGLAISHNLKIGSIASLVMPYPTLSEVSKRAAGMHYTPTLFGPRTKRFVRLIQHFLP